MSLAPISSRTNFTLAQSSGVSTWVDVLALCGMLPGWDHHELQHQGNEWYKLVLQWAQSPSYYYLVIRQCRVT
eukprot:4814685-Amphidinium_carterae.2